MDTSACPRGRQADSGGGGSWPVYSKLSGGSRSEQLEPHVPTTSKLYLGAVTVISKPSTLLGPAVKSTWLAPRVGKNRWDDHGEQHGTIGQSCVRFLCLHAIMSQMYFLPGLGRGSGHGGLSSASLQYPLPPSLPPPLLTSAPYLGTALVLDARDSSVLT